MGEVSRKAITQIDACGGQPASQQGLSCIEPRLGKQVRMAFGCGYFKDTSASLQHGGQLGCGTADDRHGDAQRETQFRVQDDQFVTANGVAPVAATLR